MAKRVKVPEEVKNKHPGGFVLQVSGECMEPTIHDKSVVVVDVDAKPKCDGSDVAIVEVSGVRIICRPLAVLDQVVLMHDNPQYANVALPESGVKMIGAVVYIAPRA